MPNKVSKPRIRKVRVPEGSLAARSFARVDYADAYRLRLPDDAPHDIDSVTRAFCMARLGWVEALIWLRNRIVSVVHLKTELPDQPQPITLEPGTYAYIFRIYQRAANEILLGEDDRHLDYRVSVLVQQGQHGWYATISTIVHFNNWLGRIYFVPVRPFHRLIVQAMMKTMFHRAG
ncbi:MAG: DUF2867 domain-containing protein [Candidatus Chloroheliales bacterium]|nr:MAG: DUF2867 domain-containing protein [Chloroflexota bacterium]